MNLSYINKDLQEKNFKEYINKLKTDENKITTLMEDIEVFKYNTLNDDLTRAKMKYNELKYLYVLSPTKIEKIINNDFIHTIYTFGERQFTVRGRWDW
jgi:hypothetical protein